MSRILDSIRALGRWYNTVFVSLGDKSLLGQKLAVKEMVKKTTYRLAIGTYSRVAVSFAIGI